MSCFSNVHFSLHFCHIIIRTVVISLFNVKFSLKVYYVEFYDLLISLFNLFSNFCLFCFLSVLFYFYLDFAVHDS